MRIASGNSQKEIVISEKKKASSTGDKSTDIYGLKLCFFFFIETVNVVSPSHDSNKQKITKQILIMRHLICLHLIAI